MFDYAMYRLQHSVSVSDVQTYLLSERQLEQITYGRDGRL